MVLKIKTTVYTDASNGEFVNIFGEIIQALIANMSTTFTVLPYTQPEMESRLLSITEKTNAAEEGSRSQKDARVLERSICEQMLFRLAAAVLDRANQAITYEERVAIVNLSKFTLYKPAEPVGSITPPTPKAKMTDYLGTIAIDWKGDRNVNAWILQHVAGTDVSPSANWQTIANLARCKYVATGLSTGYHSFRIIAISAVGESAPSEAVTEFAK